MNSSRRIIKHIGGGGNNEQPLLGIIVAEDYGSAKMRYDFKKYIRYLWESKSIEPSFTQRHDRDHNETAINLLYGITNAHQLESIIVNSCLTVIKQSHFKASTTTLKKLYVPHSLKEMVALENALLTNRSITFIRFSRPEDKVIYSFPMIRGLHFHVHHASYRDQSFCTSLGRI
eukprot:gene3474-3959_t